MGGKCCWLVTLLALASSSCSATVSERNELLANAEVTYAYPAVVSLGSCSATIVEHGVAVTAAHCRTDGGRVPLYAHRHDGTMHRIADVARWVSHPDRTYLEHDVAALFFDPSASKSAGITPIRVDWRALTLDEPLSLVGHGGLHELLPLNYQKRIGSVFVQQLQEKTAWVERRDSTDVGACSGDSGGPALRPAARPGLVGIISHAGVPCGARTRLQRLDVNQDWLRETIRTERPLSFPTLSGTIAGRLLSIDSSGRVLGWYCDPDAPLRAPLLALYYDRRWHVETRTRPTGAKPGCPEGAHAFLHQVQPVGRLCSEPIVAAAWNLSGTPGASYRLLDNSAVRVPCDADPNHDPFGELLSVTRNGRTTTVFGWAQDPDRTGPTWVRFWDSEFEDQPIPTPPPRTLEFLGEASTDEADLFEAELTVQRWPARICAFAVNAGVGGADEWIGCRTAY